MALQPGTSAPDFTLRSKGPEGLRDVTLSAHFGRDQVVLLFFPFAFTGVCTKEMCSMSGELDQFAGLQAAVYGVSCDSPFAQEAWAKENAITVPLLSDFGKTVCAAYGVQYESLVGLTGPAKRSAFVIGRDGKIKYSWFSDDPHDVPDFAELKAALAA